MKYQAAPVIDGGVLKAVTVYADGKLVSPVNSINADPAQSLKLLGQ